MLSTLSTVIHNLSSQSNILTILHNATVQSRSDYPPNAEASSSRQPYQSPGVALSSVFQSNPLKPALGKIFDQYTSLHVMLSPMPKTQQDAELLYSIREDSLGRTEVQYSIVLEVLKDETPNPGGSLPRRFGQMEQLWVPLVIRPDGLGLKHAFYHDATEQM